MLTVTLSAGPSPLRSLVSSSFFQYTLTHKSLILLRLWWHCMFSILTSTTDVYSHEGFPGQKRLRGLIPWSVPRHRQCCFLPQSLPPHGHVILHVLRADLPPYTGVSNSLFGILVVTSWLTTVFFLLPFVWSIHSERSLLSHWFRLLYKPNRANNFQGQTSVTEGKGEKRNCSQPAHSQFRARKSEIGARKSGDQRFLFSSEIS